MKTTTLIIIIVVAAVVLLGALAGGVGVAVIANQPELVANNAISGAITDLFEREEIKPLINTLTQGSVTFAVKGIENEGEDMMDDVDVSGKLYFSESKKAFMLEDLIVEDDEHKIQGSVYVSEDMIYVSEQEILRDAYGAKFDELADDLADSIFAYGSGSDYAIADEKAYDAIIKALESASNEQMQKDAEKVLEELKKEALKAMKKNFEFTSENDEIRIDGSREKVRVVSIIIDAEDLAAAIEDYYDFLANDDSMIEFLEKYEDELALLSDTVYDGMMDDDQTFAEMYEEALEELGEQMDDLEDNLEKSMDDEELIIKVITPRNSQKLVKLVIEAAGEDVFVLEVGMDGIKKTNKISITVNDQKYVYEVEENTRKEYVGTIKVPGATVEIEIDKSREDYTVRVKEEKETVFTAKGEFVSKGNTVMITVDKFTTFDYDYWTDQNVEITYDCEISVELNQKDKMPAAPKDYNSIADITEKDIEKWIERVSGNDSEPESPEEYW